MFEPAGGHVVRRLLQAEQPLLNDMAGLAPQRRVAFGQHLQQTLFLDQVGLSEVAVIVQQRAGVVDQIRQLDGFGLRRCAGAVAPIAVCARSGCRPRRG